MRFTLLGCLFLFAAPAAAAARASQDPLEVPEWARASWLINRSLAPPLAFTEGNIIDVASGEVLVGAHIVVQGDRIVSIGYEHPPDEAEIIDIRDKWVIPGLFDLHAHVLPKTELYPAAPEPAVALAKLLEYGVTTIRCLPLVSEEAHAWSASINTKRMLGPTMVVASPTFERLPQRTSFGFRTPAMARAWVQKEALLGSRWIKVYNSMDAESLRAIVETAHAHGMRVCGHTEEVPPLEASNIGMDCIEHMISIPLSCMQGKPKTRQGLSGLMASRWEAFDPLAGEELLQTFKRNGTAWVPTLVVTERIRQIGSHDGVEERDPEVMLSIASALRKSARLAVRFHRMGGLVGIGSDFPIDGVEPGKSVHRELELLVQEGGATPLEALQMATLSSARILGMQDLLGSLRANSLAEFLVLSKNPLEGIEDLGSIELVVHQGQVHKPQ